MGNTLNNATLALVKRFEGLRLEAYRCPADVWTIGYGHTRGVNAGDKITETQAEVFLRQDLMEACKAVSQLVKVKLNNNQFGALVSFVFNVGRGAFEGSTMLRHLNRGWYEQVLAQFARWNKVDGKEMEGLTKRRRAEAQLWNSKDGV